jgi:two-component system response regulator MtrA
VPDREQIETESERLIRVADLTIDIPARQVIRNGTYIPLTQFEFDLLVHLVRHRDEVVTFDELLVNVWPCSNEIKTPKSKIAAMAISRLRRKLGTSPTAPRYITNVRGRGYKILDV